MSTTLIKIITLIFTSLALAGCLTKSKVVNLPDAENQLFTTDGRYFVSGADSVFEITKSDNTFKKEPFGPKCNYAGLAQYKNYLLANCMEVKLINAKKQIFFAELVEGQLPEFQILADLSELSIPNGLAVKSTTATGAELLIGNSNYFGAGSISRLVIEDTEQGLSAMSLEKDYMAANHNVNGANGLRMLGDTLYFTDFDSSSLRSRVAKVEFDSEGQPKEVQILRNKVAIYDDLWPMCGGVIVADYLGGRLIFINQDNDVFKSDSLQFPGASSVVLAQGTNFEESTLLVTEKGILLETGTPLGNQLSQVPLSADLLEHVGCNL